MTFHESLRAMWEVELMSELAALWLQSCLDCLVMQVLASITVWNKWPKKQPEWHTQKEGHRSTGQSSWQKPPAQEHETAAADDPSRYNIQEATAQEIATAQAKKQRREVEHCQGAEHSFNIGAYTITYTVFFFGGGGGEGVPDYNYSIIIYPKPYSNY